MFVAALLSISKCEDCKAKEFNGQTLKCKKCGDNNLHITNRFKSSDCTEDYIVVCSSCNKEYEIHNDIKNSNKGLGNNED